jgi:hypothetical protein
MQDVIAMGSAGALGQEVKDVLLTTTYDKVIKCEPCILGKGTRQPSATSSKVHGAKPNEIIHTDIWGPAPVPSQGGSRYILTCYDDDTHRIQLFFLRRKSDVAAAFERYLNLVENHCSTTVKYVRCDNGGEFTAERFKQLLAKNGIASMNIPPAAHAQNGRVERVHLTVLNMVRTLLIDSKLPESFWAEAAEYAAYIRNRVYKTGTKEYPQALWTGRPVSHHQLYPFGCTVYVREHTDISKLKPRYKKCLLMGWLPFSESIIKYYDPATRKFNTSRDVRFDIVPTEVEPEGPTPSALPDEYIEYLDEPAKPLEPSASSEPSPGGENNNNSRENTDPSAQETEPAQPAQQHRPSRHWTWELGPREVDNRLGDGPTSVFENGRRILPPRQSRARPAASVAVALTTILDDDQLLPSERLDHVFVLLVSSDNKIESIEDVAHLDAPRSYREARNDPHWPDWLEAINAELAKFDKYDVYDIEIRRPGMRVLKARWVFTRKVDGLTGQLAAFKARWVAKGFAQIEGLDYNEVTSAVVHKDTIRVFLALVNYLDLECDQVDIVAAFLNGVIKETIYMEPPEGSGIGSDKVVRLKKSLYGLKQSPRCFNEALDAWLRLERFIPSGADPCLYIYHHGGVLLMLVVHVDDQLIASNDRSALDSFKSRLNAKFECKDQGPVNYFLGFNVIRDRSARKLYISQEHYLDGMLKRFNMGDCSASRIPLPTAFKPVPASDEEFEEAKHLNFPQMAGSILYAATISRPDLSYPASLLARYISKWSIQHYNAAKHLLRYIRGTTDLCLTFDGTAGERIALGYADADWGGCLDSRRSTTGYVFQTFGGVTSWKSRRQATVALSTAEAEYMASGDATKQAVWLRQLLRDLGFALDKPLTILNDNQGAVHLSKNPGDHNRTKHIDLRHHYLREQVQSNTVALQHTPTTDNLADLLTKPLPQPRTKDLSTRLGLHHKSLRSTTST